MARKPIDPAPTGRLRQPDENEIKALMIAIEGQNKKAILNCFDPDYLVIDWALALKRIRPKDRKFVEDCLDELGVLAAYEGHV